MHFRLGILTFALSSSLSISALAAPFPFTVESTLVSSTYTYIDPTSTYVLSDAVSWTNMMSNFSYDFMGKQAYATISNYYTAPGTYNLLANSDPYWPASNVSWTLNPGQIGLTGILNWNSNNTDFLVVWDVIKNGSTINYLATDVDGDGIRGFQFVNGPFLGFNYAVDATLATPVPGAAWLFGSGLLSLIGIAKRKVRT